MTDHSLFGLPTELRLRVLRTLFDIQTPQIELLLCHHDCNSHQRPVALNTIGVSIYLTCRQLRDEAATIRKVSMIVERHALWLAGCAKLPDLTDLITELTFKGRPTHMDQLPPMPNLQKVIIFPDDGKDAFFVMPLAFRRNLELRPATEVTQRGATISFLPPLEKQLRRDVQSGRLNNAMLQRITIYYPDAFLHDYVPLNRQFKVVIASKIAMYTKGHHSNIRGRVSNSVLRCAS